MRIAITDLTFDVSQLHDELRLHPEIWNAVTLRTSFPNSPHREVDDIWVRYNALENFDPSAPERFSEPHYSVWYPVVSQVPHAKTLASELFKLLDAERLGGVLVTRVAAGRQVYPHTDPGWHARFYDKFVIQVAGNREQAFCFEGEALSAEAGQCYWFDNQFEHWVINNSNEDRISLIVCLRKPKCHLDS